MEHVSAVLLELLCYIDHVVEVEAAICILISGDPYIDDEILAASLSYLVKYIECELESSIDISAVLVSSLVVEWAQESSEKSVCMCCVDLDSISACCLDPVGCISKLSDECLDLLDCYRSWCFLCIVWTDI